MTIVLKENNEAIRQKIRDAGIDVCNCTNFIDADWLDRNADWLIDKIEKK